MRAKALRTLAFAAMVTAAIQVLSTSNQAAPFRGDDDQSFVSDWSTRSVVFSGIDDDNEDGWMASHDPRYRKQRLSRMKDRDHRRGNGRFGDRDDDRRGGLPGFPSISFNSPRNDKDKDKKDKDDKNPRPRAQDADTIGRDWATSLTAGGTVGNAMYPAKFTFDFNATPSCTNDFVVFNTSLVTAVAASQTGTFQNGTTPSGSITIGGTLQLTASTSQNTGNFFQVGGDESTNATNLAAAIARNGSSVGVTATSSGTPTLVITALSVGSAGNSIGLLDNLNRFSFGGGATSLAGGTSNPNIPSIIAYNQLYSTQAATLQGMCGGTGPAVTWSYWTGGGAAVTSPVLSLDGTKVIYVESWATGAKLRIVKWKAGQGTLAAPVSPDQAVSDWSSCSGGSSCVVSIALSGTPRVTRSSPFYDYSNDALYVGDDDGVLHKITPVQTGTPAEVIGSGWPLSTGGTASATGTFTSSSATGTVTVNGTALTASPGAAATKSTTVSSNGVVAGNTITITNTAGTVYTLTASAPVAKVVRLADNSPGNNSSVTIAGIAYIFKTADWSSLSMASTQCFVRTGTVAQHVSRLASAITTGSDNTGASVSTWQCGATANQSANGVTVTGSTSPNVDITAKIAGSTAFSDPTGTAESVSVTTAGSNGSTAVGSFPYWAGATAASATALATNIFNAINLTAHVGFTVTNPSAGVVLLTASSTGLAGNGISVATTIPSGAPFTGNLANGTAGTTSGTTFSTSTDSATDSVNLAAGAAALSTAINSNVPAVVATSAAGVVTVTAAVAGTGGNSIALVETLAGFGWSGGTLSGGADTGVLASPVLDANSERLFVGDSNGRFVYITNAVSGTAAVGSFVNQGGSIVDAPIVDSSNSRVYVFNGTDASQGSVFQYNTSLTGAVQTDIGNGAGNIHPGAFDQKFWGSANGTGNLFTCGKANNGRSVLYRVPISAGVMQTTGVTSAVLTTDTQVECSPVTEMYNTSTATDWIFLSVGRESSLGGAGCAGNACLLAFNVTGATLLGTPSAAFGLPANGTIAATTGIVIDNVGSATTVPNTTTTQTLNNSDPTTFNVTSSAGFQVNDYILIDAEMMRITAIPNGTSLTASRPQNVAHNTVGTAVVDLRTTYTNGSTGTGTTFSVLSTTTFDVGDYIQIDNEAMKIDSKTTTSLTVLRAQLGSANVDHPNLRELFNLTPYPQAASIYFTSLMNMTCNGTPTVGCAMKLTQNGLK